MIAAYLISALAILSAVLAFVRPTIWSCFAACALNVSAVIFWWAPIFNG